MVAYKKLKKKKEKPVGNSQKWSRLLTGAVAYESFSLQSLNSVTEYHFVSIFTQKTEQETVHPDIF